MVEPLGSPVEHKRLLLLANSPARTPTAMDEARALRSLVNEKGVSAGGLPKMALVPPWPMFSALCQRRIRNPFSPPSSVTAFSYAKLSPCFRPTA